MKGKVKNEGKNVKLVGKIKLIYFLNQFFTFSLILTNKL